MPGPYPLATLAATVDANGISAPTFADIFASLQASFRLIYGNDIDIDADTQDGQWLALLAKGFDDCNKVAIATYNQFSPNSAVGVGLSLVVKVNGLNRGIATFSTATVTVVGQPGGTIISGLIGDNIGFGSQWALPDIVVIPIVGQIDVTVTSLTEGAITAAPGTLTNIITPSPVWQTVTNAVAATPGAPVEYDPALRQRQSISTNLPAKSPFTALRAAVAEVTGVQRVGGHENNTDITDLDGVPPHSLALVVDGGLTSDVVNAIAVNKTPGVNTVGTISAVYFDQYGVPSTINYYPLSKTEIYYTVVVKAKTGYTSRAGTLILQAVADYLNNLQIGEDIIVTKLNPPASLQGTSAIRVSGLTQSQLDVLSATYEVQSIFIGLSPSSLSMNNLILPFNTISSVTNLAVNGVLTVIV